MSVRTIRRRRRANEDIDAAIDFYLKEAGAKVAGDFIDEFEAALAQIAKRPTMGSLRYAHSLNIHGLRYWPFKRFPYLVFYREKEDRIEIARVLHGSMDIPANFDDDQF